MISVLKCIIIILEIIFTGHSSLFMEIITYSLCDEGLSTSVFQQDVSEFTDTVIEEANHLFKKDIYFFLKSLKHDYLSDTTYEESILELLLIGTYWINYIKYALDLQSIPANIMKLLNSLRSKLKSVKHEIDKVRGLLTQTYLRSNIKESLSTRDINLYSFDRLLDWLSAAGEFTYEVPRLRLWFEYLKTLSDTNAFNIMSSAIAFASWFNVTSEEHLGKYTENVECFLENNLKEHEFNEDFIMCNRQRVEYHVNMVGAEIMNRVYRKDFLETQYKLLLLPSCMRKFDDSLCKATHEDFGSKCSRCTNDCNIFELVKLGQVHNFNVRIIYHSSDTPTKDSNQSLSPDNTGLIGVACLLNLISGGWKAKSMGFHPQCVILNFCGCRKHWHEKGIPTSIDIKQLFYMLNIPEHKEVN